LSLSHIIEAQEPVWYLVPLLPIWVLWVMVVVAETNRAPFDLPESEGWGLKRAYLNPRASNNRDPKDPPSKKPPPPKAPLSP
ncbi:5653_t:CDS:1, partial [Racocetra fulgida]